MKLIKKILDKFNGLYYPQEYLCLAKESLSHPLHVYLAYNNQIIKDITNHHSFVGYSPLIFALPSFDEIDLSRCENLTLFFAQAAPHSNEFRNDKDALATIVFKKTDKKFASADDVYFYQGQVARHRLSNSFHQFIVKLNNDLYNKKPGNVFLDDNLYKQVQIAYSVPRNISLITTMQTGLFNLFPTDLHGMPGKGHYIISLRHGGKAAQQVETTQRILISQIAPAFYRSVYGLGKNHMQQLKEKNNFPFSDRLSSNFQIPVPKHAVSCRELELMEFFDHGIHRLFLFNIISEIPIDTKSDTLAHIHNIYASWRHNNRLSGNYLFR